MPDGKVNNSLESPGKVAFDDPFFSCVLWLDGVEQQQQQQHGNGAD